MVNEIEGVAAARDERDPAIVPKRRNSRGLQGCVNDFQENAQLRVGRHGLSWCKTEELRIELIEVGKQSSASYEIGISNRSLAHSQVQQFGFRKVPRSLLAI